MRRIGRSLTRLLVLLGLVCSCAAATTSAWDNPRRERLYKPGQSITEARICTCDECLDRRCCSGEREDLHASPDELGMTLSSCGRCVRRVWTARGTASCAETAAAECCAGTVSD